MPETAAASAVCTVDAGFSMNLCQTPMLPSFVSSLTWKCLSGSSHIFFHLAVPCNLLGYMDHVELSFTDLLVTLRFCFPMHILFISVYGFGLLKTSCFRLLKCWQRFRGLNSYCRTSRRL